MTQVDSGQSAMQLDDGSTVGVIGGGPAGSLFTYFLLDMAERVGLDLEVHLYEPRDFSGSGPASCNMCGGIISETLIQNLAAEGINLPTSVVQRGIDSYVLHMDAGTVHIDTPLHEKRIGAVHRAGGPRNVKNHRWESFDGHLQALALKKGAVHRKVKAKGVAMENGKPVIEGMDGSKQEVDLLAVAVGVNSPTLNLFQKMNGEYQSPETSRTFIREFFLGEEVVGKCMKSSMHVFLVDIPDLEFAAIVPKGDYVSICLLGRNLTAATLQTFFDSKEVRECMPSGWEPAECPCQCGPKINVKGSARPFGDRLVFIGDSGVTRLYKDGIGAAYRTAKAAASTAIFQGISSADFERGFFPVCRAIERDNDIGKFIFSVASRAHDVGFARAAILKMVRREQETDPSRGRMSSILWDMFTGSASYRDILMRSVHPVFMGRMIWHLGNSLISGLIHRKNGSAQTT